MKKSKRSLCGTKKKTRASRFVTIEFQKRALSFTGTCIELREFHIHYQGRSHLQLRRLR